jgi:glycine cleavage system aminomethyltransferase T
VASRLPGPGRIRRAPMLGHDGRLKGDLTLFNWGDGTWWIVGSYYLRAWHLRWFTDHLVDGVHVRDVSDAVVGFSLSGPRSRELLARVTPDDVSHEALPFMTCRPLDVGLFRLRLGRLSVTGELGYELYLKNASRDGVKLWNTVWEAGQPHGLQVIGPSHIRRIEGGILAYGSDMTLDTNPFEVGIGYKWMVDLRQEADFMGRAALERIKEEGVSRKLVGVEIGGEKLGAYNDGSMIDVFPVSDVKSGQVIGKVTSACYSPRLEKNIGYAMIPIEYTELGTELIVDTPAERTSAVVVPKPFHDPTKEIPKGQPVEPVRPVPLEADEG